MLRHLALATAVVLGMTACEPSNDDRTNSFTADAGSDDGTKGAHDADDAPTEETEEEPGAGTDVDCSEDALTGGDEEYVFTSAYLVENGELDVLCFGDDDPIILDAWDSLATIAPAAQLADLVLFGGFEPDGSPADETLAFVNPVDSDGTGFQMSINTLDAGADPDELLLTIAHEFSHVFTATPEQLDRSDEAVDECTTYFNGEGCYEEDSVMYAWTSEFWEPEVLAELDRSVDVDADADGRCAQDDGFFGPYAATNPEEDFAEAFSAFVFRVEPATDGQNERLVWIGSQPGLVEFRDRADGAGMTPLANNFDVCGF